MPDWPRQARGGPHAERKDVHRKAFEIMDKSIISGSLDRIRGRYLSELDIRMERLVELRARIDDDLSVENAWTEIGFLAHKLAGTSATLGFQDLGDTASLLDNRISSRREREEGRRELVEAVDQLLSHMRTARSRGDACS